MGGLLPGEGIYMNGMVGQETREGASPERDIKLGARDIERIHSGAFLALFAVSLLFFSLFLF